MYKLRLPNYPDHVLQLAVAKSYGIRNSIKLEGFQKNFKVALQERPPEKSCSTSSTSNLQRNSTSKHAAWTAFCQKLWKFVSDFFRFIKAKNLSKTKQAIYENNEAKQAS